MYYKQSNVVKCQKKNKKKNGNNKNKQQQKSCAVNKTRNTFPADFGTSFNDVKPPLNEMLLTCMLRTARRNVTKKKQWDREGESGCWPGYIDFTLVIFKIIPFLLLPSANHRIIYVKPGTFLPLLLILIYFLISRQNSRT